MRSDIQYLCASVASLLVGAKLMRDKWDADQRDTKRDYIRIIGSVLSLLGFCLLAYTNSRVSTWGMYLAGFGLICQIIIDYLDSDWVWAGAGTLFAIMLLTLELVQKPIPFAIVMCVAMATQAANMGMSKYYGLTAAASANAILHASAFIVK